MRNKVILIFMLIIGSYSRGQDISYTDKLDTLYNRAYTHLYSNKDSTSFYFNQIFKIALEKKDWANTLEALISENRNAGYFYDLSTLQKNLDVIDSLYSAHGNLIENLEESGFYLQSIWYDKGNYYFKTNDFKKARGFFLKIINQLEYMPKDQMAEDQIYLLSSAYSFMAKMYQDEEKFELAQQFYTKDIRYLESITGIDAQEINTRYTLLASLYAEEHNYIASNALLKKVLTQIKPKNIGSNRYIATCNKIAQNYIFLKKPDSASLFLSYVEKNTKAKSVFRAQFHIVRSENFQLKGNYTEALNDLKIVLENENRNRLPNGNKYNLASIHLRLGKLHEKFGRIDEALAEYDTIEALSLNATGIERSLLLETIGRKALLLNKQSNQKSYEHALKTTQRGTAILTDLKPSFSSDGDKLRLIETAFPIFESGIEAAYQLSRITNDSGYIDEIFEFSEKSKASLLLEALLNAKATQFANIPDSLLEKERQLKSEITYIEKQLNNSRTNRPEKEDILFTLQKQYRNFIDKLEKDYMGYYDLKYNNKTLTLDQTQNLLQNDEKMISYFYGNEAIYGIAIDKSSKRINKVPITSNIEKSLKQLHEMLADPESDILKLAKISNEFYQTLILPLLSSKEKKKLIIVPDGRLNYIPFGALNTSDDGLSYLMEHHTVSYSNSSTLHQQLTNRNQREGKVMAFAPKFSGEQAQNRPSRDQLMPLPHNRKEVEQILNSFDGKSFINENATLQNFTNQLSKYNVIHLATHAVFNDVVPEYSYLAFSTSESKENLLFVNDLYNLQIDADLVTLSACESGIGELKRGEGFLSLTRGFFYSGASSITSTLWKINDASTSNLMNSFYQNLSKGETKDIALQKAKIMFLNANRQNGLSHPYYWSGFIISGNTQPLLHGTNWFLPILMAFIVILIVPWIVYEK